MKPAEELAAEWHLPVTAVRVWYALLDRPRASRDEIAAQLDLLAREVDREILRLASAGRVHRVVAYEVRSDEERLAFIRERQRAQAAGRRNRPPPYTDDE